MTGIGERARLERWRLRPRDRELSLLFSMILSFHYSFRDLRDEVLKNLSDLGRI
jgi:hypothetical protein